MQATEVLPAGERYLTLNAQQSQMLADLQAQARHARERCDLVLAAILAQHEIEAAEIVSLDPITHTLTVHVR